jgi:hypothetical protein
MIDATTGQPTINFLLWVEETSELSEHHWEEGFLRVKRKIIADAANDREPWPPSTPAMFIAMCRCKEMREAEIAEAKSKQEACGGAIAESRKTYVPKPKLIEDFTAKSQRRDKGNSALSDIKNLF